MKPKQKLLPKRLSESSHKAKTELNRADVALAIALGQNDYDDDDDNDHISSSSQSSLLSSSADSSSSYNLRRILLGQRSQGIIPSRIETKSLILNTGAGTGGGGRKKHRNFSRDYVDLSNYSYEIQERRKSNLLLFICFILTIVCTILIYDRQHHPHGYDDNLRTSTKQKLDSKSISEQQEISNDDDNGVKEGLSISPNYEITEKDLKTEMSLITKIDDGSFEIMEVFSLINQPFDVKTEIPVYFYIPMTGGVTLEKIMSVCLGLILSNQMGTTYNHGSDKMIDIVQVGKSRYVNVDTTTQAGIERAKKLGLISSGLTDVIVSPFLHDITTLFQSTNTHKNAKCFTLLHHPIERAIAVFTKLKQAAESGDQNSSKIFELMTIEEYAKSKFSEDNWMVRFLTNTLSGPLSKDHLELAKMILEHRCLVGFLERFEESLGRFEKYFRWDKLGSCQKDSTEIQEYPTYEEGSEVWMLLKAKNEYDLDLYKYALDLYSRQELT